MPADATRLIARLRALKNAAEMTPYLLVDVAHDTIEDVQRSAATSLGSLDTQVGFDLQQFQANIAAAGPLQVTQPGVGRIGILDTSKMGSAADFERIRGEKGLFHQGTGDRLGTWRDLVYPSPSLRQEVAQSRRAVWGDKTPQWYLYEHGFTGSGAFPATPPTHFIENATKGPALLTRLRTRMAALFRGI